MPYLVYRSHRVLYDPIIPRTFSTDCKISLPCIPEEKKSSRMFELKTESFIQHYHNSNEDLNIKTLKLMFKSQKQFMNSRDAHYVGILLI